MIKECSFPARLMSNEIASRSENETANAEQKREEEK